MDKHQGPFLWAKMKLKMLKVLVKIIIQMKLKKSLKIYKSVLICT